MHHQDTQNNSATSLSQQFLLHAGLGGLAGLFMKGSLHPIDTVRTRIKTNALESVPLLTQVKTMQKYEGNLSYFRGFSCTLSGGFIANASYFFVYEKLKHTLSNKGLLSNDTAPFASAFIAGALSDILALPFDVVRTRMQLKPGTYDYRHFWDGAKKVIQREGFSKLYLGGPAFFALTALENGLTFGFYELFYKTLVPFFPKTSGTNLPLSMTCSVLAAAVAGLVANPLDVLVTRLQSADTRVQGTSTILEMAKQIYKNEGFKGFMKGVTGTMSYFSLGALLLFPTYEVLKNACQVDLSK